MSMQSEPADLATDRGRAARRPESLWAGLAVRARARAEAELLARTASATPGDSVWSVPAPGTCLIVVSWEGYSLVRTIVVR
jgi:hypothetical protein